MYTQIIHNTVTYSKIFSYVYQYKKQNNKQEVKVTELNIQYIINVCIMNNIQIVVM